jgi:hypothetical protein
MMLRRISCEDWLLGPWGPCFVRATAGPVGRFLLSLSGLNSEVKSSWNGRVFE